VSLTFECLEEIEVSGKPAFILHYDRLKGIGAQDEDAKTMIINGSMEVKALNTYIALFPLGVRNSKERFFQYLKLGKNRQLTSKAAANNQIGKNPCAEVGKQVAVLLKWTPTGTQVTAGAGPP
jgi:hypothetical protein